MISYMSWCGLCNLLIEYLNIDVYWDAGDAEGKFDTAIVMWRTNACPLMHIYFNTIHAWTHTHMYILLTHWPLGDLDSILKVLYSILFSLICIFKSSYDNVLLWMPQDLTDDKSALVQIMAWCRQTTIHYLNQCRPRSPSSHGFTRP